MQFQTFSGWLSANPNATDDEKLTVLRGYIFAAAKESVDDGYITAGWANKKLLSLGIVARLDTRNSYTIEVPASGKAVLRFSATSRAQAMSLAASAMGSNRISVSDVTYDHAAITINGPEDTTPVAPDNAPATVADLLAKLRETVMLAHVAGPRICSSGASDLLAEFGLDPLPETKRFTVRRDAEVTLKTSVEAYDEDTAKRVAEWRWEDAHNGYSIAEVIAAEDTYTVTGDIA